MTEQTSRRAAVASKDWNALSIGLKARVLAQDLADNFIQAVKHPSVGYADKFDIAFLYKQNFAPAGSVSYEDYKQANEGTEMIDLVFDEIESALKDPALKNVEMTRHVVAEYKKLGL